MHEVAEARPGALPHLVLSAARLSEVRHGTQLGVDWSPAEPASVQVDDGLLGVGLVLELDVDVPHQMITEVVTHVHLLYLAVLVLALDEDLLEEVVVMFLKKVRVGFHFRALHSIIREEEECS